MVIYAGSKDGMELKDFWLWELDEKSRVRRFAHADTGRVTLSENGDRLILTLEHSKIEGRDEKDPEDFSRARGAVTSDRATFELPLDKITGTHTVKTKLAWLTFSQLLQEWHRLDGTNSLMPVAERAKQRMSVQITIHEKCATSFSVLSFALIAIPLSIKTSRKETSANLGLALALTMAYYFGTIVAGWADQYPALRPDLLMWLPNFGFQALGGWLLYRIDRC